MQKTDEKTIDKLPSDIQEQMKSVGIDREGRRAGSYMLSDSSVLMQSINSKYEGKVEMLDTKAALNKYPWAHELRWKAVDKDKDRYTKEVAKDYDGGYFIWVKRGARISLPIQACMMISTDEYNQRVHNIIVIDEGADAKIITGCALHPRVGRSSHIGISEFYIRKGAKLNFTMVHNWNESTTVRPRSAAIIEEGATFVSNYVLLNPVKDIEMYPCAKCVGKGSRASFNNLMLGMGDSRIDAGSRIELCAENTKGEVISRTIAKDRSTIIARGQLIGDSTSKAHLECKGIMMGHNAKMHAIPELIANTESAELSHEAAVGKIAQKEITYLQTRGLSQEQAVSMIVRGFMDVDIFGLPEELEATIRKIMDSVTEGF